ncbi:uncharacterized protein KNN_04250 [Bacillus thuringiensis serovar tolworthi]|uniref:Uncharacterized protein n=1 Tax=Bacillus thuringiensis subsp. tolworthi TaxID=1442 RepID=A0A9W4EVK1_BACTO|nr:uncharacterized protein KNN_04250 [Bacillus thuringiensis serovar tolworthi]
MHYYNDNKYQVKLILYVWPLEQKEVDYSPVLTSVYKTLAEVVNLNLLKTGNALM